MQRVKSIFLLLLFALSATAQTGSDAIRGTVTDELGEPLIGASLKLKKSGHGCVTDIEGRYALTAPSRNDVVIVSYLGYETQEIPVSRLAQQGTIRLQPDSGQQLQEVVVTGMQKMDKRLFTGATTKISAADAKLDGMADISRSLEGRAAGVSVQNVSGTFGTAPKIRVRGATSIYGNSKPLWVIDGVIMEDVTDITADDLSSGDAETLISSAVAGLNADDIETFDILKDGSATSIYGARAMSGVIVVTTKKGKAGTARVGYTGEYTLRLRPQYRDYNIMNSQEQMAVYQEMRGKGWFNFADTYRASKSGIFGKMYQLTNTYDPATGSFALTNDEESQNNYLREAERRNTDWFGELFSSSIQHNHSVSVSAGTENISFYGSLSAMFDPGRYRQNKVERYTANMNTSIKMLPQLTLNLITNGYYRKQREPGTLSQSTDVVNGEVKRDFDINPFSFALNSSRTMDADEFYTRNYSPFNIKNELDNNYIDLNEMSMKFQGELKWKPVRTLEIAALASINYLTSTREHQIREASNQAGAYRSMADAYIRQNNPWLYHNPDNPYDLPISILPVGGIYLKNDNKMLATDFRLTGSWNYVFQDTHIVNLFAGSEVGAIDRQRNYFNGWGMQYEKGELPFYLYEFFKKSIEDNADYYSLGRTRTRSAAFFANGTYSYKGRYTVNGTYRYEGTNRLGRSRSARWLPTWNISGAWNVHEEPFFEKLRPTLSNLSVKASYSLTADPGPLNVSNATLVLMNYKPYRPFSSIQETGMKVQDIANEELTYEKKHELNLGLAVGFLGNRINVEFDWFRRNNYDLIGPINSSGVGGAIKKWANVADMKSSGTELSITTKNIQKRNFSWETNFIFTHVTTEVTNLQADPTIIEMVQGNGFTRVGYPHRALFSFRFNGLDSYGLPLITNQDGNIVNAGATIKFQSQLLDNLVYEGPTEPTTYGSLGNILKYKNFRLNLFVTYSFGNVLRLYPSFRSSYSDLDAMPQEFQNRWLVPGDEQLTDIPVILTKRQVSEDSNMAILYNAYNYSTARTAKGDFIRMKEVSISYDFPKAWIKPLHISDLSLKLQATNLFLFYSDSKLHGQDPEFVNAGGVASPIPKQFTMTLRLGI